MKRIICILLIASVCLTSAFSFDLNSPQDISNVLDGFSANIVQTIPTEVSVDNLWADAYIGNLLALPPHVALGVNFGSAFIKDNAILSGIGEMTGIPLLSKFPGAPVPAASINARIGGIILPFDIGFHFMALSIDSENNKIDGNININTWGADFRYCILEQKLIIPAISAAIGYEQVDTSAALQLNVSNQDLDFDFYVRGTMLTGTAEVSWKLLFMKVFAGARAIQPLTPIAAGADVYLNNASISTFGYTNDAFNLQVFGGLGFRLLVIDSTIGASYDVINGNLGLSFSTRVQL